MLQSRGDGAGFETRWKLPEAQAWPVVEPTREHDPMMSSSVQAIQKSRLERTPDEPADHPLVSIIVLNFNGARFLLPNIESIRQQSYSPIELMVVDNCSTDGSAALVRGQSDLALMELPTNIGYGAANNYAAHVARGEFLLFLNVDTRLDSRCIERLVLSAKHRPGIFAPRQLSYDGSRFISCGMGCDIFGYPVHLDDVGAQPPFYADGAALFVSKCLFFRLDQLDPVTFFSFEDIDFCWRGLMQGIEVVPVPGAIVFHEGGGSLSGGPIKGAKYTTNGRRRFLGERNLIRNLIKNYSVRCLAVVLPLYAASAMVEMALLLVTGRAQFIRAHLKAYMWNVRQLPQTLRVRALVQQKRTVGDQQIMARMYKGNGKLVVLRKVGVPQVA